MRLLTLLIAVSFAVVGFPVNIAVVQGQDLPEEDFIPSCVRVGDENTSIVNIEFSPTGEFISWGNPRTPRQGYDTWTLDYWITGVDTVTGDLIPSDGKGFRATTGVEWGTFAYWGLDARGSAVYTSDGLRQIYRILMGDGGPTYKEQLTGPLDRRPQYIYASLIPDHPTTYLVYLKDIGPNQTGHTIFEIFWLDASQSDVEHQMMINGRPYRYPYEFYTNPRWVPGRKIFVFPFLDRNGYIQVAAYYIEQNLSRVLTVDGEHKIDPFPFIAPEYPDEWLLMAIVGLDKIGVYQRNPVTDLFQRIKTIDLPSVFQYEQSAESFTWNGKTYISVGVNEDKPGARLSPGTSNKSELWITDIDPASTFTRKVSTDDVMYALDPEALVTESGVWVYGYMRRRGSDIHELQKCRTGLGN